MRKVACPLFLSVHDRHQRKGLGCKLVGVLIEIGREKVIDEIVGQVRTENHNKLEFAGEIRFTTQSAPEGYGTISLKPKEVWVAGLMDDGQVESQINGPAMALL